MKRREFLLCAIGAASARALPAPLFAEGGLIPPGVPYLVGERCLPSPVGVAIFDAYRPEMTVATVAMAIALVARQFPEIAAQLSR